ncbi:23S rRNA (uracil(1939)-C(5))-methyltransferase RlmD [Candidatus Kapabacteria bacterium]|nr:23S rRNA (uracil(1939)-C(5))-methyltransferase RlmD [Candidatus Kapabacteria bacterium]
MARKIKKEVINTLEIESIGFNGVSIARKDEKVHFVKGGVPGDKVSALQIRKKKSYTESLLLEILEPSENRIEPKCKYFGTCGGCSWQNMPYQYQLDWKKKHVEDAFFRQNHFDKFEVNPTMGSPKQFNYRNKMEFSFGNSRWLTKQEISSEDDNINRKFAFGMHIPGRFDKILDLEFCHISDPLNEFILNTSRDLALEYNISGYDRKHNTGFLRNFIIRSGSDGAELLAIIITNNIETEDQKIFIEKLSEALSTQDKISGFIHAINSTKSPVRIESSNQKFGRDHIFQEILDINFRISPFSFFQTNSFQLNNFIGKILEISSLKADEIVWDLYCGTGSISLPASKHCKKIIGFELVESSINDAKVNADLNSISNTEFHVADLHEAEIPKLLGTIDQPDKVIVDPPRAGMHKNLIEHLLNIKPKQIIYVSCNPMTQARDCELMKECYDIKYAQPVDMFPHTYHIENIVLMELKS